MMFSPDTFIKQLKDYTFPQLIAEKDSLVIEIKELEKIVYENDRTDPEWNVDPSPDIRYQMNLEYLAALCKLIKEKYNREIVGAEDEYT